MLACARPRVCCAQCVRARGLCPLLSAKRFSEEWTTRKMRPRRDSFPHLNFFTQSTWSNFRICFGNVAIRISQREILLTGNGGIQLRVRQIDCLCCFHELPDLRFQVWYCLTDRRKSLRTAVHVRRRS
jgi:hypothetical protein